MKTHFSIDEQGRKSPKSGAFVTFLLITFIFAGLFAYQPGSIAAEPEQIDRIVVVVNNDVILESELSKRINQVIRSLKARRTRIPPRDILKKQVLERMILLRIQLQMAKRTGIKVSDDAVNRALVDIARKNRMNLFQFRRRITAAGLNFSEFRENIRTKIILGRLQHRSLRRKLRVSKEEVDHFLATQKQPVSYRRSHFKVQHILIAVPDGASASRIRRARAKANRVLQKIRGGVDFAEAAVTWSNGQRALKGGVLGWFRPHQLPRFLYKSVIKLGVGEVSGIIRSASGFHIVKLMNARGRINKHIITQSKVRHILIRVNALTPNEEAKRRLNIIRNRVLNGESFAIIAKANSDDPGTARKGGALGWTSPGDLVPRFEATVKKLRKGDISKPFRTRFGWHIVQLIDRRQRDDTAKYKRSVARRIIRSRKHRELLEVWLQRLRDESYVEYRNGHGKKRS